MTAASLVPRPSWPWALAPKTRRLPSMVRMRLWLLPGHRRREAVGWQTQGSWRGTACVPAAELSAGIAAAGQNDAG